MKDDVEVDLMRLLHGELPAGEAAALRSRLEREPELDAAWRRLKAVWEGMAAPATAPVPVGFTGRVMAQVRAARRTGAPAAGTLSWAAAPNWLRAACAAALVAGLLIGAGLGAHGTPAEERSALSGEPGLSESYWVMVDDTAGAAALPSPTRGEAQR
jgi:anti-sigma factor RsiW